MIDYFDLGGKTIAQFSTKPGFNKLIYLHDDHLGSPVMATKSNGDIDWREVYLPYGEKHLSDAANDNNRSFTGHIEDTASGLTYMQARYYHPATGRFLSSDPVGFAEGGTAYFNRYAYTANDPVNAWDPDGEKIEFANIRTPGEVIQTAVALAKVFATPTGREALVNLETSSNTHTITLTSNFPGGSSTPDNPSKAYVNDDGSSSGGTGSTIRWNPNGNKSGWNSPDDSGNRMRDPAATLGHEIGHSTQYDTGTHPQKGPFPVTGTPNHETGKSMTIENEVRANSSAMDQRSNYVQPYAQKEVEE